MNTPNFSEMNNPQLVMAYNEMVMTAVDLGLDPKFTKTVARFADTGAGIKRCEALHSEIQARKDGLKNADKSKDVGHVVTSSEHTLKLSELKGGSKLAEQVQGTTGQEVSPGLKRLRAHPGAEKLRQDTLEKQEQAKKDVAQPGKEESENMATKSAAKKAKAPKKAKAAKAPAKAKVKRESSRGFKPDQKITVVAAYKGADNNPKRGTAAKRFEFYADCDTVGAYAKKVGAPQAAADLRWDVKQGFIRVT